jgi:hypothetical protein
MMGVLCTNKKEVNDMSDYVHRNHMMGETCHVCDEGTITGTHSMVSCDNCDFSY